MVGVQTSIRFPASPLPVCWGPWTLNGSSRFRVGITKDGKWIINGEDPRGWNLDGGELPTVKITPESRPVMLDPSRGQDGFFIGEPSHINPPFPASAPASSACPTRKCTMC